MTQCTFFILLRRDFHVAFSYQSTLQLKAISLVSLYRVIISQGWLSVNDTNKSQIEHLDSDVIVLTELFVIV